MEEAAAVTGAAGTRGIQCGPTPPGPRWGRASRSHRAQGGRRVLEEGEAGPSQPSESEAAPPLRPQYAGERSVAAPGLLPPHTPPSSPGLDATPQ